MLSFCNAFQSLIATFRMYLCIVFSTKKIFYQQTLNSLAYDVMSYLFIFFLKKKKKKKKKKRMPV